MEWLSISLLKLLPDVSAVIIIAAFISAIYFQLKKSNKSEEAESTVYVLLTREIERLNRENTEVKKELEMVRQEQIAERRRCAEEIAEIRQVVYELQNRLNGS
jgi:hypothetical protein